MAMDISSALVDFEASLKRMLDFAKHLVEMDRSMKSTYSCTTTYPRPLHHEGVSSFPQGPPVSTPFIPSASGSLFPPLSLPWGSFVTISPEAVKLPAHPTPLRFPSTGDIPDRVVTAAGGPHRQVPSKGGDNREATGDNLSSKKASSEEITRKLHQKPQHQFNRRFTRRFRNCDLSLRKVL